MYLSVVFPLKNFLLMYHPMAESTTGGNSERGHHSMMDIL